MSDPGAAYSWPQVLNPLLRHEDLEASATAWAMEQILSGAASPAQLAGFVIALRSKGETVTEVEGLVATMRDFATRISVPGRTLDVVGTGGDQAHTVNISTMSAIVAAGAGAKVLKHGNRAASSACGAADVLEELGVPLDLTAEQVAEVGERAGITFCFAPAFHPALRHAAVPRRELGVPTTFNFLGPLANPGNPSAQAVGVGDSRIAGLMAGVLARRGIDALVFHGDDGLDELTTRTTSQVWVVGDGKVEGPVTLDPRELGIEPVSADALKGADAAYNAKVVRALVDGEPGAVRDVVLLNAGAALAAYTPEAGSVTERIRTGMDRAAAAIDSGAAKDVLDRWIAACAEVRG
ncbi:anthranilate phosphoribosyltransferase [Kribbella sp. VKM Ac-2571]|uniref:anthranilate phosphoribosyltransferase n=1 Tax=Kribbella sp. VKM Ac-2571 TaxID=2512222 RepID=UPI00105B97DD|nr:anthranilate phosphoribosyltransferase [Kribbella sp. VKM Ac-2571]TDO60738.1 anthranilate phosphoribosyltransferase [Kribbella sp. VKM Ac-2571]